MPSKRARRLIKKKLRGFTLVEILIVVIVLSVLVVGSIAIINPFGQIAKAEDTTRISDIRQINNALALYYSDNGCYIPQNTLYPLLYTGGEWLGTNGTVYMKKIPLDPDKYIYTYLTSAAACPQWAVIFGKLSNTVADAAKACSLAAIGSCTPQGYDSSWACFSLGTPDCPAISSEQINHIYSVPQSDEDDDYVEGGGDQGPGDTCAQEDKDYACLGDPPRCNVVAAGTGTYCSTNCGGYCP